MPSKITLDRPAANLHVDVNSCNPRAKRAECTTRLVAFGVPLAPIGDLIRVASRARNHPAAAVIIGADFISVAHTQRVGAVVGNNARKGGCATAETAHLFGGDAHFA